MKKKVLVALTVSLLSLGFSTSVAGKYQGSSPTTDGSSSAWAG